MNESPAYIMWKWSLSLAREELWSDMSAVEELGLQPLAIAKKLVAELDESWTKVAPVQSLR